MCGDFTDGRCHKAAPQTYIDFRYKLYEAIRLPIYTYMHAKGAKKNTY